MPLLSGRQRDTRGGRAQALTSSAITAGDLSAGRDERDRAERGPDLDPAYELDAVLLQEARHWYRRQSMALREWILGLEDEPDFVRAITDDG